MATKENQENGSLDGDLTFPHSYEVEEEHELPGTGGLDVHVYYIPPTEAHTGTRRSLVKYSAANWQILGWRICIRPAQIVITKFVRDSEFVGRLALLAFAKAMPRLKSFENTVALDEELFFFSSLSASRNCCRWPGSVKDTDRVQCQILPT